MTDDVRRALLDPGYTPRRSQLAAVLPLLADPVLGKAAERALLSAGAPAAALAAERLEQASTTERAALLRLVTRELAASGSTELLNALLRELNQPDPVQQRDAAFALGKAGRSEAELPLLAHLASAEPRVARSIVEALGKIGGPRSLAALSAYHAEGTLAEIVARARLMLERGELRSTPSEIALDAALPQALGIVLSCRPGFSRWLAEEAAGFGPELGSISEVRFEYRGPLRPLTTLRCALDIALEWRLPARGELVAEVLAALTDEKLTAAITAWTRGRPRFRLAWERGHRRADTWRIAEELSRLGSPLVNDPTAAPWSILVQNRKTRLLLSPVGFDDPRFAYRVRDVPAASHPTLAAALSRVAEVRADDVVWDPFVGSGLELCERALLGPFAELHGSDIDPRALEAARQNLDGAGLSARLEAADARRHTVRGVSLVLSNPPMGRRVARERGLPELLCEVVRNVSRQLVPGGRLVWLSPFPAATASAAAHAGLTVQQLGAIDLGGFAAELQRFVRH